jgi:hypothetical protein
MTTATLEDRLRSRARELGFAQARITRATLPGHVGERLEQAVGDGTSRVDGVAGRHG